MLLLTTKKSLTKCCGGCASGRPCCGSRASRRRASPFGRQSIGSRPRDDGLWFGQFAIAEHVGLPRVKPADAIPGRKGGDDGHREERGGERYENLAAHGGVIRQPRPNLFLPRGLFLPPRAMLQYPGGVEWGGRFRPWLPPAVQFDVSCAPCCTGGAFCCGFADPQPTLTITVESDCATIDGFSTTFDHDGECWDTVSHVAMGGFCIQERIQLCCSGSPDSCFGFVLATQTFQADGCGFAAGWTPVSCSCDPFELSFSGEIIELLEGTCLCCDPGDAVTIRITL